MEFYYSAVGRDINESRRGAGRETRDRRVAWTVVCYALTCVSSGGEGLAVWSGHAKHLLCARAVPRPGPTSQPDGTLSASEPLIATSPL